MNLRRLLTVLVLFFLLFYFVPPIRAASTYYVRTDGSDSCNGLTNQSSASLPNCAFKSINYVLMGGILSPGDTLEIADGIYNEIVRIPITLNGTSSNYINIIGNGNVRIIGDTDSEQIFKVEGDYFNISNLDISDKNPNPGEDDGNQCVLIRESSNYIFIENFKVHGCNGHGLDIVGDNITIQNSYVYNAVLQNYNSSGGGWSSGLKVSKDSFNTKLYSNTVYDNWGEGIAVTQGVTADVAYNVVYNNFGVGIYIDNSYNIDVRNNYIYSIDGAGAILRNGEKGVGIATAEEYYSEWGNQLNNIKIFNNIIYNTNSGFVYWGADSGSGGARNISVLNNTFYCSNDSGAVLYIAHEDATSLKFYNNIVRSGVPGDFLGWADNTFGLDFDYNYWVDGSPASNIMQGSNDLYLSEADLKFAIVPGFALLSSSKAIDEGVDTSSFGVFSDYIGTVRGGVYDIGAYEYVINPPSDGFSLITNTDNFDDSMQAMEKVEDTAEENISNVNNVPLEILEEEEELETIDPVEMLLEGNASYVIDDYFYQAFTSLILLGVSTVLILIYIKKYKKKRK